MVDDNAEVAIALPVILTLLASEVPEYDSAILEYEVLDFSHYLPSSLASLLIRKIDRAAVDAIKAELKLTISATSLILSLSWFTRLLLWWFV